ncbi:MAG: hypothetical protein IJR07_09305 [Bacteroidaceae bacterium]|nr:hypothetical protein [Bacteroidaceae bacterium]
MVRFSHIKRWVGLLLSLSCLLCFIYGMYLALLSMMPLERTIRYADLGPLPRGLTSIDKLLNDRLPADSTATTAIVAYRYDGHTLYDVVRGNDTLTIPAHITDTIPPVFVAPPADASSWSDSLLRGTMPLNRYALDYRRIIARYDGQVCRIEWSSFDTIPLYIISLEGHDEPIYINATTPYVKPFYLDEAQVREAVKDFCRADSVSTELLTDYDNYYVDLQRYEPLPMWRVVTNDRNFYVNPRTGAYRSYPNNSWWYYVKHYAFNTLRYKLFAKHPERWAQVMWGVLIAGFILSFLSSAFWMYKIILCNKKGI